MAFRFGAEVRRVSDFIATLAPHRSSYWEICRREGMWGVVGRGNNWKKNALTMVAGDRVFVWQGGRPNGFIAEMRSLATVELVGPATKVPWPDRAWFGGVFPVEIVAEAPVPLTDRFPDANGRFGERYGFNNTVLQHSFEEIPQRVAELIAADLAPHML